MSEVPLSEAERRAQEPARRRRAVRMHRIGRLTLVLIALAALAGLLGPGPLNRTSRSAGPVEFGYDRFTRYRGNGALEVRIRPDPARSGTAQVWISAEYLAAMDVQQVVPWPAAWTAAADGSVLAFPVREPQERVEVQVRVRPDRIGLVRGAIGAPGEDPTEFWQFVYP